MFPILAEERGFEPPDALADVDGLANRCFRPLSHSSINIQFGGPGWIRTNEAEAPDLQSGGFSHLPTDPNGNK